MRRILTALVAVPALLIVLLALPAWTFFGLALASAALAFWEMSELTRHLGWKLLPVGYAATLLLVATFFTDALSAEHVVPALLVLVGAAAVLTRAPSPASAAETSGTIFGVTYIGTLIGCLVGLRAIEPDATGRHLVIFLLAVVMLGDAGAYYVGRSLGRRRLAPGLSPKKTVEGLVGGVLASAVAAAALAHWWLPALSVPLAVALGAGLSLLSVFGDLFVSFLKRSAGVKDTSSVIPGHGGILDRLDSVLFAAPVLFALAPYLV